MMVVIIVLAAMGIAAGGGYTLGSTAVTVVDGNRQTQLPGLSEPPLRAIPPPTKPPEPPTTQEPPSPVDDDELGPVETEEPVNTLTIDESTRGGPSGSVNVTGASNVALTFDDGPHPEWTPRILEKLRQTGTKATFCLIGSQAKAYPELVVQIVNDGHTLCNHSWNHDFDLGDKTETEIIDNLQRTNDAINSAVPNASVHYYRQPGGMWTPKLVSTSEKLGMIPVHWSVDPRDWDTDVSATEVEQQVLNNTVTGGIILMHDGGGDRQRTYTALDTILPGLASRFTLVSLP